jgi:hypothetical protein
MFPNQSKEFSLLQLPDLQPPPHPPSLVPQDPVLHDVQDIYIKYSKLNE